jgi:hypothetical protein
VNGQRVEERKERSERTWRWKKTVFCDFLGKYVWTGLGRGYGDSRLITFWAFMSGSVLYFPHISGWISLLVATISSLALKHARGLYKMA